MERCVRCGKYNKGIWKVLKGYEGETTKAICPGCNRGLSNYYEAILQLRQPRDSVIDFVIRLVDKNKQKGVFITKTKRVTNGVDFYITKQHFIRTLGKKLQQQFGGVSKLNAHLQSRDKQRSKNLYRMTLLYTVPIVMPHDIVSWDKGVGCVRSVGKKDAKVFDLTKQRNSTLPLSTLSLQPAYSTNVTIVKPHVEVLDPETYQSVPVRNPSSCTVGSTVKVVQWNSGVYIIDKNDYLVDNPKIPAPSTRNAQT